MHAHHHHAPDNAHGHSHSHAHEAGDFGRAFAIGIGLNLTFVAIEVIYGIYGHSVALLSDAGHNLGDVLGLAVAWGASVLGRRPPTARYTYGLGGTSILAALFNALFLLIAVGAISWEAIQRLMNPAPVAGTIVMIVAAIGVGVNGATALLFASGRKGDLNIRGAFQHMLADAVIAAGVVVTGLLIKLTGAAWLDPSASLVVNGAYRLGNVEPVARCIGDEPQCRPARDRTRGRAPLSRKPAGRDRPPRSAYLADEHHGDRLVVPPRHEPGTARRCIPEPHMRGIAKPRLGFAM